MLPAALLSTHTGGFGKPAVLKTADFMESAVSHWKENGIDFDLVYVGYLGSTEAVEIVQQVMDTMIAPGGITVVDPALADHGKRYSGLDAQYTDAMFRLCRNADFIIPNITEAAMMAGVAFREESDEAYVRELLEKLPASNVLLTGVGYASDETGFALRTCEGVREYIHPKLGGNYSGTGDIFASVFCGALACGRDSMEAAKLAAEFVQKCIQLTRENPAHRYGVRFEPVLGELIRQLREESGRQ